MHTCRKIISYYSRYYGGKTGLGGLLNAADLSILYNKCLSWQDDSSDIIQDLRDEISKMRDRIASASEPNKDDVLKMEVCTGPSIEEIEIFINIYIYVCSSNF